MSIVPPVDMQGADPTTFYNLILAMGENKDRNGMEVMMDNKKLFEIAAREQGSPNGIEYEHINRLIAKQASTYTAMRRFGG